MFSDELLHLQYETLQLSIHAAFVKTFKILFW